MNAIPNNRSTSVVAKILLCKFRDDERMLQDIQRFYNVTIEELPNNVADLI